MLTGKRAEDMATPQHHSPGSLLSRAAAAVAARDAAVGRWLTGGKQEQELQAAARSGAEAADLVVTAQLDAGMPLHQIGQSAEQVLGGRFDDPTPTSDAFYRAYDDVADTYARDQARDAAVASGDRPADIEAG